MVYYDKISGSQYKCSGCNSLQRDDVEYRYCPNCGQRINWGDTKVLINRDKLYEDIKYKYDFAHDDDYFGHIIDIYDILNYVDNGYTDDCKVYNEDGDDIGSLYIYLFRFGKAIVKEILDDILNEQ